MVEFLIGVNVGFAAGAFVVASGLAWRWLRPLIEKSN